MWDPPITPQSLQGMVDLTICSMAFPVQTTGLVCGESRRNRTRDPSILEEGSGEICVLQNTGSLGDLRTQLLSLSATVMPLTLTAHLRLPLASL